MLEFGGENLEIKEKNYPGPFLLSLSDDENLTLRVVISFREDADTDLVYEIVFEHYILYQMRNESFTSLDKYEVRKGNWLLIFEKSRLLDHIADYVDHYILDSVYSRDEIRHYGIYTENHILDVISVKPPAVRKITGSEVNKNTGNMG